MAAILLVSTEVESFFIFKYLMEDMGLWKVILYQKESIEYHINKIDELLEEKYLRIHQKFYNLDVELETITSTWIITIFTNILPTNKTNSKKSLLETFLEDFM